MPKKARELVARQVSLLREPGLHAVGGVPGLAVNIKEGGEGRSWILRFTVNGKRCEMGLGGLDTVSFA